MIQFRLTYFMFVLIAALSAGCVSPSGRDQAMHRMVPYQPFIAGVVLDPSNAAAIQQTPTNLVVNGTNVANSGNANDQQGNDPRIGELPGDGAQRILSRGDRIMISLRGIPRAEEIKNVIDGTGEITLPFIGQVAVAGLTPSEAERLIEEKYINGGFYRSINVIVVAEDKVYFVQGEVSRQGKFTMSGDVTLLQAITEAGGYTPFANRKNVKVIRGDEVLFFNAREIEDGEKNDPVVMADDIIVVQRTWY